MAPPGQAAARLEVDGASAATDSFALPALYRALAETDWRAPWFAPHAEQVASWLAHPASRFVDLLDQLNRAAGAAGLRGGGGHALRFVPQAELPPGTAYEAHIAASGAVPTRANLHDIFNALSWFAWPRAKAAMNAAQGAALRAAGVSGRRGGLRDALTLLDENGAVFACADARLGAALRAHDWHTLFVAARAEWGRTCALLPLGHALLEKWRAPYKAMTAHAVILPIAPIAWRQDEASRRACLDEALATALDSGAFARARPFAPLPVCGVPGWWAANADPAFYADAAVFRPCRATLGPRKVGWTVAAAPGAGEESPDSDRAG